MISNKVSNVRTWSYVANKKNWVENSDYWVQLTKDIEDKLSDKLHEELTKSFIDKKISILSRSLKQDLVLNTEINDENKIYIDGQFIGKLNGLKFLVELTPKTLDTDIKSIKKAARKGVKEELNKNLGNNIQAFDLGFKRSVVTILDANITTLIASIILFIFGSGPVKGFAVTLSIGLITTLFSAYFISRHLTSIIVLKNKDKKLLI